MQLIGLDLEPSNGFVPQDCRFWRNARRICVSLFLVQQHLSAY